MYRGTTVAVEPSSTTVGADELKNLLDKFPRCTYCFAYGSAVFAQKNQNVGRMVDLVFVVDNPLEWHTENMELNIGHYSALKHLGPKLITYIQENLGTGIYYNTFATVDDKLLKYGVISTDAVIDDLGNWKFAYIAGRLHKPVRELQATTDPELVKYVQHNHESALRAALLQLPQRTTKFELYYAITELSYIGDSRMVMGENPNKVENIVASNHAGFDEIYVPLIQRLAPHVKITSKDTVIQDTSPNARLHHLLRLPSNLQQHIAHKVRGSYGSGFFTTYENEDIEEIMRELSTTQEMPSVLRSALGTLVLISSIRQTATGFLSTGVYGSIKYAFDKLRKALYPNN